MKRTKKRGKAKGGRGPSGKGKESKVRKMKNFKGSSRGKKKGYSKKPRRG